jgi:hypothetical protein
VRGAPAYADRFAELVEFGAWLNSSIQILERAREYRPSNQATAAPLGRLARRFCEAARSVDVLAVRTMHVPSPPRAAFAVSATMLTFEFVEAWVKSENDQSSKSSASPGPSLAALAGESTSMRTG